MHQSDADQLGLHNPNASRYRKQVIVQGYAGVRTFSRPGFSPCYCEWQKAWKGYL